MINISHVFMSHLFGIKFESCVYFAENLHCNCLSFTLIVKFEKKIFLITMFFVSIYETSILAFNTGITIPVKNLPVYRHFGIPVIPLLQSLFICNKLVNIYPKQYK